MAIDTRNIVLVGMPGVGKSTLGIVMAKILTYNFLDTDLSIQIAHNATLSELIAKYGDKGFIDIEGDICASVDAKRTIIATGGSAVYSEKGMAGLKATGPVVYLRIDYDDLIERLGSLEERGVVLPQGWTLRDLYDYRCGLYEKYADITVQVGKNTIEATARTVAAQISDYMSM